uniref:Uncharacterized protein n=1 Tax=Globodera rostochiensis TaxID=31243 RepID=A0A914ICA5_GLORO
MAPAGDTVMGRTISIFILYVWNIRMSTPLINKPFGDQSDRRMEQGRKGDNGKGFPTDRIPGKAIIFNPWAAAVVTCVLNPISAVTLITAVGIGVEFTAHVALAFLTSLGTREERMVQCLQHMFVPVIHGGMSTLLGIIMLAFSDFDFVVKAPRHFRIWTAQRHKGCHTSCKEWDRANQSKSASPQTVVTFTNTTPPMAGGSTRKFYALVISFLYICFALCDIYSTAGPPFYQGFKLRQPF